MRQPLSIGACVILLCLAGRASAQDWNVKSSIEWMTSDSDVVVQGVVTDLTLADVMNEGSRKPNPNFYWATLTLKVQGALKGKPPERIVFVIEVQSSDKRQAEWKEHARPLVWFFRRGKSNLPPSTEPTPNPDKLYSRDSAYMSETMVPLALPDEKKNPVPYMTMDLNYLDEPAPVLAAIKAEVARDEKAAPDGSTHFTIPTLRAHGECEHTDLLVPVNARLEECARVWAAGVDGFIKQPDDWNPKDQEERRRGEAMIDGQTHQLRTSAIRLLRLYRSDETAAFLRTLLTDSAHYTSRDKDTGASIWNYYVRDAAVDVLKEWGEKFNEPVTRESAPK